MNSINRIIVDCKRVLCEEGCATKGSAREQSGRSGNQQKAANIHETSHSQWWDGTWDHQVSNRPVAKGNCTATPICSAGRGRQVRKLPVISIMHLVSRGLKFQNTFGWLIVDPSGRKKSTHAEGVRRDCKERAFRDRREQLCNGFVHEFGLDVDAAAVGGCIVGDVEPLFLELQVTAFAVGRILKSDVGTQARSRHLPWRLRDSIGDDSRPPGCECSTPSARSLRDNHG